MLLFLSLRVRNFFLYSPVVTIYTASLTFNNSTFCPHSVFMCFVWTWEQTAIISLYNINWLFFVMNIRFVLCEVGTDFPKQAGLTVCQVRTHPVTPAALNDAVSPPPPVFCENLLSVFLIKISPDIFKFGMKTTEATFTSREPHNSDCCFYEVRKRTEEGPWVSNIEQDRL